MSKRDSQRQKLYDAEEEAVKASRHLVVFKTVDDTQKYVEWVLASRWFEEHYGSPRIRVKDGRRRRSANADHTGYSGETQYWTLNLPRWARTNWTILHEVAHVVSDGHGHRREFARTELALIRRFIGAEDEALLKAEFKKRRVRYRAERKDAHVSRPMPDALVAARIVPGREKKK